MCTCYFRLSTSQLWRLHGGIFGENKSVEFTQFTSVWTIGYTVLGPASMVLSIHDRPYASLPSVALGMATLFVGNLILVPTLHLTGAALSAVIAITAWSLSQWWVALRTAGMDVSILQWFRSRRMPVPAE